jgi:hypothetical protein
VAQCGRCLQQCSDIGPQVGAGAAGESREIRCQQRRVVVAQILAKEGQAPCEGAALDAERKQKQDLVAAPADDDCRRHAARRADMALPGGQPVEGLEWCAVGGLLKRAPDLLDACEIVVRRQRDGATLG